MKKLNICLLISSFLVFYSCGTPNEPLKIAFWNVENLFDLVDHPETNDDEFALEGSKKMNEEILEQKLTHLAEVITEIDADLFGLCEVENIEVINMLNNHIPQKNYQIVHYDSPDNRGIDVMLYYDPDKFEIEDSYPIGIQFDDGKPTRDILYVKGRTGLYQLHLFVNHWPSNYGGKEQAIPRRAKVAGVLRNIIDSILLQNPDADILVMGDLNENPQDENVRTVLNTSMGKLESGNQLRNLMGKFRGLDKTGTYVYRGEDLFLDQLIVSKGLIEGKGLVVDTVSVNIHDLPKYCQQEGDYAHYPFRFWAGDKLLGGYSDHLAVMVNLYQK